MDKNKSPKKSLGQNFLKDPKILRKIASFAEIKNDDLVLEIGPGEGTLTKELILGSSKVISIEKDRSLCKTLGEKFKKEIDSGKLEILEGDILDIENFAKEKIISEINFYKKYKIVGNIPYYITGAIFKKFLENNPFGILPSSLTFVIQKEVAERILARDKKESILSMSIKAYGEAKIGGIIKSGSFFPKPKVDSTIIKIENISNKNFKDRQSEQKFFEILKLGFSHKRKILVQNLRQTSYVSRTRLDTLGSLEGKKEGMGEIFEKCKIPLKARAENLTLENWLCLLKEFSPK